MAENARILQTGTLGVAFHQFEIERDHFGQLISNVVGSGWIDAVTSAQTSATLASAFTVGKGISHHALGNSMITANLAALTARRYVEDWTKSLAGLSATVAKLNVERLTGLSHVAELVARQNETLIRLRPAFGVAQSAALATRAFEETLRISTFDQKGRYPGLVDLGGHVTGWTLDAGVRLTAPSIEAELVEETETALGPSQASAELRSRLQAIDPELCVKLDGAWARIENGGTDAGRQAAHSLMEVVDWTLRTLAPEDDVLAWRGSHGPKPGDLDNAGHPTRELKIRYVASSKVEVAFATDLYRKAINALVKTIQDPKHGMKTTDPKTLRPVALSVEGFLLFLVGD
jgi:hypothetical protein